MIEGSKFEMNRNENSFASIQVEYLEKLNSSDELYAEYFWWRDYYEIRNRAEDRAQAYCDLCAKLNNPNEPPKVYEDMFKWWVTDSHCKKLKSSAFGS